MIFGKQDLSTFERGVEKEWLVTNGLGGYAAGTAILANARKYHGLLMAALNPPGGRRLMLAKLDEYVQAGDEGYNLASNEASGRPCDSGFIHLQAVKLDPLPAFTYVMSDITLKKRIFMVRGQNITVVSYRLFSASRALTLYIKPFVNNRGYHYVTRRGQLDFTTRNIPGGVEVQGGADAPALFLTISEGEYMPGGDWYLNMTYPLERERGEDPHEDHFMPGQFKVVVSRGEEKIFHVVAGVQGEKAPDPALAYESRKMYLTALVERTGIKEEPAVRLIRSADAFIVRRRSTGTRTIIAGYPWFTDWGRDTMIALPGLTLVTGRFEVAREILATFARYCRQGIIPNAFGAGALDPLYNTVDASLWYFYAVYKYLEYTGDFAYVKETIYPVLKQILHHYQQGTLFGIRMDRDGLILAGESGVQLTWMDAKVGDWVVTPRRGKPVEVEALWYNALMVMSNLSAVFGEDPGTKSLAGRVRESFLKLFWNEEKGYLHDYIDENGPDMKLRPNQLMALCLPYPVLSSGRGKQVVNVIWRYLYTDYGIRSLAPFEPGYHDVYIGDQRERDGAYHQGTAWSWLMGPFVTAYRRVHGYSKESRLQAKRFLEPFAQHLNQHGVGYISEIFDAGGPNTPRGCPAQAWGVAEVLRAYVEEALEIRPQNRILKGVDNFEQSSG